jgi:ComF family protein
VIGTIWNNILDYIYPPRCLLCSELILNNNGFCIDCWSKLNFITEPYCQVCCFEFSIDYGETNNKCARCLNDPPYYDYARSLLRFDAHSKKIIHALKYYDRSFVSQIIAKMLVNYYKPSVVSADLIVPVPMHRFKRLSRLYNHAQILSSAIALLVEKKITPDILLKTKYTKSQTGLARKYRLDNLSDSITVANKQKIRGKKILLVDDVMTTGATINLCAKQLKKAGAKEVVVLCIARTLL